MPFRIRRIRRERERPLQRWAKRLQRLPIRRAIAIAIVIGRPLWALGKRFHERHEHEQNVKRALTIGVACVVALAIVLLAFSLLIKTGSLSLGSLANMTGAPIGSDENGITNVLLLGQGDETGQDLTDAIIIASIDARAGSVVLLSLPRDLYFLHTAATETEKGKLNALWRDNRIMLQRKGMAKEEASFASLRQLKDEIGDALGIEIHHAVKVDFAAAEKAIDFIGGIDLAIPEMIHDTEFPDGNYGYETFHIDTGLQHLDGATALKYARTRSTTSDFDRSARQQWILKTAAEKAREEKTLRNPQALLELFTILREHVTTDLTTRQLLTLANVAKALDRERFVSLQLNDVNGLYGEQLWKGGLLYAPPRDLFEGDSVLLPVSIPEFPVTFRQIRLLSHLLFRERQLHLDAPTFTVLNGGAPEGSASRIARELTKFGFDVTNAGNVPNRRRDIEKSFISRSTEDASEPTVAFFSELLSTPIQPLPDEMRQTEVGDITMVLGRDFEFRHFQDLIPQP